MAVLSSVCLHSGAAQESSQPSSSSWDNSGSASYTQSARAGGEVLPVEFVIKLKGGVVEDEDRITLEGEAKIENSRLKLYFKKLQREQQQTSYSYGGVSSSGSSSSSYGSLSSSSTDASTSGTLNSDQSDGSFGWSGEAMAGIAAAHFKLLSLQPMASTGKVTAELYMGENDFSPYLEAVEVRLNPFKKTEMELLLTSFQQVDLRSVRVVVHLDGPVKEEWKDKAFTADFRCYLQVGDSHSSHGYGNSSFDESGFE